MKKVIYTDKAPKPIGPYSQAVCIDGWLFISGQIPLDPSTGNIITSSFEKQVERVLESLKAIVEYAGGSVSSIVKTTIFLRDISMLPVFNEVYSKYFKEEPPARSVVEVKNLPRNTDIMIEAVAKINKCP
ncbi:MAG: RidA family protein [Thermosphaera sp.]|nr:RidA family protein [Thermosphaera sp.]